MKQLIVGKLIRPMIILKLDIEKNFDKLNCNFINYMLKVKNYLETWRDWIKACILAM